jgi:RNA polymerase sigma-70 factor (ECF subfamily)
MISTDPQVADFEKEALPHLNDLFRTARSTVRNHADAEDVVADAYVAALKSFHRFTPGTNCRAWLFSVLFHTISHHRRKWFNTRLVFSEPDQLERISPSPTPIDEELKDEEILAAFRKIPRQFADVVMLADVQDFSYKEIQEILNIPIGTVMSRLSRGRQLLRVHLVERAAEIGIRSTGAVAR